MIYKKLRCAAPYGILTRFYNKYYAALPLTKNNYCRIISKKEQVQRTETFVVAEKQIIQTKVQRTEIYIEQNKKYTL